MSPPPLPCRKKTDPPTPRRPDFPSQRQRRTVSHCAVLVRRLVAPLTGLPGRDAPTLAGPCVVNVYINYEKKFAFVEFRTVEETSNAMGLDGIMFEGVSVRYSASMGHTSAVHYIRVQGSGFRLQARCLLPHPRDTSPGSAEAGCCEGCSCA